MLHSYAVLQWISSEKINIQARAMGDKKFNFGIAEG
jgi:hypothetical protein